MKDIQTYNAKKLGKTMLNANESSVEITDEIRQEIQEAMMSLAFHRYPDETSGELIQTIATLMNLNPNQILAGNGSDEMLGLCIGYFLGKGKVLYTLAPDFSMYDYYAGMYDADIFKYTCKMDGRFSVHDFIEKGREKKVDLILFSNPNNPTGHALSNSELKTIVEAFPNIPVIIDEAYAEFANETMLDEITNFHNLYVTRTLSKAYGLAGVRLGFLVSNKETISTLKPYMVPYNISSVSQKIGVIVLQHAEEYSTSIALIKKERDAFYQAVEHFQKITFYPSSANYIYARSAQKDCLLAMFEEEGIIIRNYQDDTLRITIGTTEENKRVLAILKTFEEA